MLERFFKRKPLGDSVASSTPAVIETTQVRSTIDKDTVLVFGVQYEVPLGLGLREQELRKFALRHRASHSTVVSVRSGANSSKNQLLAAAKIDASRGVKYIAATAAISMLADPERAFVVEYEESSYIAWVSDSNRLPIAGLEVKGDLPAVIRAVKGWKQEQRCDAIILSSSSPEALQQLKLLAATKPIDVFAAQADVTTELRPVRSQAPKYLAIAAVVAVILWQGYELAKKRYVALQSKTTAAQTRQQSVAAFESAVQASIASSWGGHSTQQYYDTIKPILERTPYRREGWFLTDMECSITSGTCEQKWSRSTGNYEALTPEAVSATMRISEDFMRSVLVTTFASTATVASSPFPSSTLPSTQANLATMGDLFAILSAAGISIQNLTPPAPVAVYSGQPPAPQAPKKGQWSISTTPIGLLNSLVTLPPNATITRFKINAGQSGPTSFEAQGEYFVNDPL